MALVKKIIYPNGTESNYHKIYSLDVRPCREDLGDKYYITVFVYSYVSKDIRMENVNNSLTTNHCGFLVEKEDLETVPVMKLTYDYLKTTPEFEEALDD